MKRVETKNGVFEVPENFKEITLQRYADFLAVKGDGLNETNERVAAVLGVDISAINNLILDDYCKLIHAFSPFLQAKIERNPAPLFVYNSTEYKFHLNSVRHIVKIEAARNADLTDLQRIARVVAIAFNPTPNSENFDAGMAKVYNLLWELPTQTVCDCYFFFAILRKNSVSGLQPYLAVQAIRTLDNLSSRLQQARSGGILQRFMKMPQRVALKLTMYSMSHWLKRLVFGTIN